MARRKVNTFRAPWPPPTRPDWLSPHCSTGHCSYCRRRRAAARQAMIEAERARAAPCMFDWWERKIEKPQEVLGPSAPDARINQFVKP